MNETQNLFNEKRKEERGRNNKKKTQNQDIKFFQ